jgi:hypothetical protein
MFSTRKEEALQKNPHTPILLDAIREWEAARMSGVFSDEQRERMKLAENEFHLENVGEGVWNLYPFHTSEEYIHQQIVRQPGEPTAATWEVENSGEAQEMQVRLTVDGEDGAIVNPTFEVDSFATWTIPVTLKAGHTLLCEGLVTARVFDEEGNQVAVVEADGVPPTLVPGKREIVFDCEFECVVPPQVIVNFKTMGAAERIG